MTEFLDLVANNPILSALITAAAPGVYAIWSALVAMVKRRVDHMFNQEHVQAMDEQEQHDHVTRRVACQMKILPRGVVSPVVKQRQSERPPDNA